MTLRRSLLLLWQSGLAGRMLVAVELASQVAENLDSILAGKKLCTWLCWEQVGSSGSSYNARCETGFAGISESALTGIILVGVDMALLVAENLDLL
jgi:hypothetical protein